MVEAMRLHRCVIGGEGNGGVIDPRVVPVRDSLVAMALTLQLMADSGRTVSQLVGPDPALYDDQGESSSARRSGSRKSSQPSVRGTAASGSTIWTASGSTWTTAGSTSAAPTPSRSFASSPKPHRRSGSVPRHCRSFDRRVGLIQSFHFECQHEASEDRGRHALRDFVLVSFIEAGTALEQFPHPCMIYLV